MYTHYFGLREKPFAIAPNPRYLYMSEQHREALAHLLYGIKSEGCIILLTGDVGTGKTTICRLLIEQLPDTTDVAIVLNPDLTITDLLKTLCIELKINIDQSSPSITTYVDNINAFLLNSHAKGRSTTLVIDEAQNLNGEILEQLRLLTNLETNTKKLLQIVLIGQPELRTFLDAPELSQINQRITTRYHLKPLHTNDVSSYIYHRISVAGVIPGSTLFTKQAIRRIGRSSRGIPRLINLLCDHSLLGAYAEGKDQVDATIVKKAMREIAAVNTRNSFTVKKILITATLLLLIVILPAVFYFSIGDETTFFSQQFKKFTGCTTKTERHVIELSPIIIKNE